MSKSTQSIPRPDYGLFDPNVEGKPWLFRTLMVLAFILFLLYSGYVISSVVVIIQLQFLHMILNLVLLTVEAMIAYYSLVLLMHFARGFAPVDAELRPIISKDDLKNGDVPFISVLLSCYKEPLSIIEQTVRAALDLNYPEDKYEVVVMEDGIENDDIKNFCEEVGAIHETRDNRAHFKAGAVNHVLPKLKGDYVLFIDADHIVERNVVANCLMAWREGTIGVQSRVDFVNMLTYLTKVSAFLQIQFFSLFERGRRSTGSAIFAGGGALFDRLKLIEEGGMQPLTIADDTDTSFTLRADGHRIEYIDTVGVWALVPWDPLHQIRQVWRWFTGITRSFRARWLKILKSDSKFYVKVDHLATGFFTTLTVIGWLIAFVLVFMVGFDVPIVRAPSPDFFPILGWIPGLVTSLPIITGTLALVLDDPNILYKRNSLFTQGITLLGFYLLVIVAQPLLIGAVIKGLTGWHVEFNRTPKQKQTDDDGLWPIKRQYLIQSVIIFLVGVLFAIAGLSVDFGDSRQVTLFIASYAGIFPIIVALLWFWKLEDYLLEVGDISALEFLKDISVKS